MLPSDPFCVKLSKNGKIFMNKVQNNFIGEAGKLLISANLKLQQRY